MTDQPLSSVAADGIHYLERDLRLASRPRAAAGESDLAFAHRMARHYGIPVEEAMEILGLRD